jgi:hypothetical protein
MVTLSVLGYSGRLLGAVEQVIIDSHIAFSVALRGQAAFGIVTRQRDRSARRDNHRAEQQSWPFPLSVLLVLMSGPFGIDVSAGASAGGMTVGSQPGKSLHNHSVSRYSCHRPAAKTIRV